MKKKVVVRIGNVFCVEIDKQYKCYFQYVCKDRFMLNGQVIKVFKTRYPMEYKPVLDDIVRDEVAFYAHTFVRAGLVYKAWYKVEGTVPIISRDYKEVLWGIANDMKMTFGETKSIYVDPMENWILWYTEEMPIQLGGELPESYVDFVEYGAIVSFVDIVSRIKFGYYQYKSCEYEKLRRIPHPDVDSYTKLDRGKSTVYSHFKGEYVVQEIHVSEDGTATLSECTSLDRLNSGRPTGSTTNS